jgi:hypothetical protein
VNEKKEKKNNGLFYYSMNGIEKTYNSTFSSKLDKTRETVKKKEQKFERQNRWKMIKDICQR